jgi:hypothetical protein
MNSNLANYTLFNPFNKDSDGGLNFATQQPNVFVNGTYHIGPLGCNIKESSELKKGTLTNSHIKISLHERPYKTVPYLGKGNVDVGMENNLFWGDTLREKKSTMLLNEKNYLDLENYPIYNKEQFTEPRFHIEQAASKDWIRGGMPSRELYKNKEYKKI